MSAWLIRLKVDTYTPFSQLQRFREMSPLPSARFGWHSCSRKRKRGSMIFENTLASVRWNRRRPGIGQPLHFPADAQPVRNCYRMAGGEIFTNYYVNRGLSSVAAAKRASATYWTPIYYAGEGVSLHRVNRNGGQRTIIWTADYQIFSGARASRISSGSHSGPTLAMRTRVALPGGAFLPAWR